ncbi:MAG: TonB-dependent receptor [Gammaproteobacteria bacterium]|nr:TonB-dependent receptor [Gammaproteobacteria bacterium]
MKFLLGALALIFGALTLGAANANEALENVITRANRTALPQARVGSAVSVVDRDLIEQRQTILVSDILQDLPGIAVSRLGGPGAQTQLRIRGAEANHLLVVIDGVVANDPTAGDEFTFEQLTAWDIERLEVVRGPQSALWGSDALAGVVNVTTRRDTGDRLRGRAFAEGGSFDTTNLGAHIGGNIGQFSGNLSASWFDTAGENISRTGDEKDGFNILTANLNTVFQATDDLRLGLSARHSDSTTEFDNSFVTGLPIDSNIESDVQLTFLRAYADLALFNRRSNSSLQVTYALSERDNFTVGRRTSKQDGDRHGFVLQTSWDFTPSPNEYRLTLALDYDKEEFDQLDIEFGGSASLTEDRDTMGYAAEFMAQPWDSLNLTASLRYDDNDKFKNKTTYRLTGVYRIDATDTRLHTSLGTGMKKPTFLDLFGFFPDFFTGNPDLKPEESAGFDIGVDQGFWNGRGRVDLTWFYAELTDEITTLFFPVNTAINAEGTSRRQGLEVDLRLALLEQLDMQASYTYTDSKAPTGENGKATELRRPRHMAALNLNYGFLGQRAGVNLNVSYTGDQKDQDFSQFPSPIVTLDAYTLVNLTASYRISENFTLYARAENLFDEQYENVFGYRTPGAGYYAGVRLNIR